MLRSDSAMTRLRYCYVNGKCVDLGKYLIILFLDIDIELMTIRIARRDKAIQLIKNGFMGNICYLSYLINL